jgi:hypothetical protein
MLLEAKKMGMESFIKEMVVDMREVGNTISQMASEFTFMQIKSLTLGISKMVS